MTPGRAPPGFSFLEDPNEEKIEAFIFHSVVTVIFSLKLTPCFTVLGEPTRSLNSFSSLLVEYKLVVFKAWCGVCACSSRTVGWAGKAELGLLIASRVWLLAACSEVSCGKKWLIIYLVTRR